MTFRAIEDSAYLGEPIELYEFNRGAQNWRYTSSDQNETAAGILYSTFPIRRAKIEQTQELAKNSINITAARNLPFAQQYIISPPSGVVSLRVMQTHRTDTDSEIIVIWIGRVVNVRFSESEVTIRCESIFTSLRRPALRRVYQTTCPHVLYGPICQANSTSFQLATTVNTVSGVTITSNDLSSQADGYWTGGYIEWSNEGVTNRRFILSHTGTSITINLPFQGIAVGDNINVFPGCDHTLSTCVNKFSNELNYGGFPYIPDKSPFEGDTIF